MKEMKRDILYKLLAAVMIPGLVLAPAAGAEELSGADQSEKKEEKEETVYIFTDASGNQQKLLVNEWLKNPEKGEVLRDATGLKEIVNVKGDETFEEEGENRIVWNSSGNDIYYQGTTDQETPIAVKITYTLDGKEISPEELAGKSGRVVIRFDYQNKQTETETVGKKKEEVFVPFTVLSGMLFTGGCVKNVEVNTGKVLTEGDKTIVVGLAFPGLEQSLKLQEKEELDVEIPDYVEVSMDSTNFAMDLSMSLVMNDALSILDDLGLEEDGKLDDLKKDMEDLKDGSQELMDGTDELAEGIGELYDKVPELTEGVLELKDGIASYTDGVSSVKDGVGELKSGSGRLASGAASLSDGAEELSLGTKTLKTGADALSSGAGQLKAGAADAKQGATALKLGYTGDFGAVAGAKTLTLGIKNLDTGLQNLSDGVTAASDSIKTLADGAKTVKESAASLNQGAAGLQTGADTLKNGADALAVSAPALEAALKQVSGGLAQLKATLEGDGSQQNPGQLAALENAVRQLEAAVCGEGENDVSIQKVSQAIAEDVSRLQAYYMGTAAASETAEENRETAAGGISDLNALQALTNEKKEAARAAAGRALEEKSGIPASVAGAKSAIQVAGQQRDSAENAKSSADGIYDSAVTAYTPILSDISGTLNKAGLSKYAGYVGDAQNTASSIVSGYQSAAGSYSDALASCQGAASGYEAAVDAYENTTDAYDEAIASYEETIAGYEQLIGDYQKILEEQNQGSSSSVMEGTGSEQEVFRTKQTTAVAFAVQDTGADQLWQQLNMDLYKLNAIQNGTEEMPGLDTSICMLREKLFGSEENDQDTGSMGQLKETVDRLYRGVGAVGTQDTGTILGGMSALSAGTEKLAGGAAELATGIGTLKTGTAALSAGAQQLSAGAGMLAVKAPELADGAAQAKDGSTQLADGSESLYAGIWQLSAGTTQLDRGLGTLYDGTKDLYSGAKALSSGAGTLSSGAGTLNSGATELSSGAKTLDSGVSELQSGVSELDANSSRLVDGSGELADGAAELADGAEQLKDGSEKLRDGMKKFNEEGIEKLTSFFENDLEMLADRLKAVKNAGEDYQSFAGISDDMSGSVKFIIKTDSISAE